MNNDLGWLSTESTLTTKRCYPSSLPDILVSTYLNGHRDGSLNGLQPGTFSFKRFQN